MGNIHKDPCKVKWLPLVGCGVYNIIATNHKHFIGVDFADIPEGVGYHSTCYKNFTHKRTLELAEKKSSTRRPVCGSVWRRWGKGGNRWKQRWDSEKKATISEFFDFCWSSFTPCVHNLQKSQEDDVGGREKTAGRPFTGRNNDSR